ncbi:DNA polymerase III subunit gamma/tau [Dongia soli]|uniref:DNA polymerase III subunit gamma/tau n=1 Tax=Dongia soli TaxID=600628 RepID=A0ABU5E608_9PROT|nr:DNA polymerase III subunit gamma/tau [Dongia soli]MDY0881686.1 DNA polymerase III subunit gamma/tau [Dongia soli]
MTEPTSISETEAVQLSAAPTAETEKAGDGVYRVLARKYRPSDFTTMIGQEALVRTLTNAIAQGRLAHGFMLTGVRGVGKTTTARILARCFNCVGPDGTGGPTASPCGVCDNCRAIAEDRHVDVIEMDAASRTGIDDIRELIDGVRYRPVSARYKVYIVDEVHMLSEKAFNALLKTLEEPPAHVKFIFATTEIRKVPVTVLSRCQRFDLRRVEAADLAAHFARIAEREGAKVTPAALALIARAADGSVRDGLSLLDQAIALSDGEITDVEIRDMLGLADRTQLFDLYDRIMRGDIAAALAQLAAMYHGGADPVVVIQDLLDLTHWLTRAKITPDVLNQPTTPEAERQQGSALAANLSVPMLSRTWQMLLKGLSEVQQAPQPLAAAEMVLIRLTHAANLPTPGDLVKQMMENGGAAAGAARPMPSSGGPAGAPNGGGMAMAASGGGMAAPRVLVNPSPQPSSQPSAALATADLPQPQSFAEVVALFSARREAILHAHLQKDVHLVRFETGRIEFRPAETAPRDLASRLAAKLGEWTGKRWMISVSGDQGQATLKEQAIAKAAAAKAEAAEHPLVKAVLQAWPGAAIEEVRDLTAGIASDKPAAAPAPASAAAEGEDAPELDADYSLEGDAALDGFAGMDGLGDDEP